MTSHPLTGRRGPDQTCARCGWACVKLNGEDNDAVFRSAYSSSTGTYAGANERTDSVGFFGDTQEAKVKITTKGGDDQLSPLAGATDVGRLTADLGKGNDTSTRVDTFDPGRPLSKKLRGRSRVSEASQKSSRPRSSL